MSARTTFPDVTLAEQRPLTTPVPDLPDLPDLPESNHIVHNSTASVSKDTMVVLSRPQQGQRSGIFITRAKLTLLLIFAFLVLTTLLLLTAYVTRELCLTEQQHQEEDAVQNHSTMSDSGLSQTVKPDAPLFPDHPFSGLRLPRSLVPSHYDLELRVNLDTFLFSGACNITLNVNTSTRYVVFHRSDLALNESLVTVRSHTNHRWLVVKQYHVTDSQFHILELDRELPAGLTLKVEVGMFAGFIRDDLRGLYQSSYKTPDGKVQ